MTDAPKTIWAQDAVPDECDYIGGGWWDDTIGSTQYPHMEQYTLTSSVQAQLKAADELAEVAKAMARMIEESLKGTGYSDVAITPDEKLKLNDAFKRITAYRKAKEASK